MEKIWTVLRPETGKVATIRKNELFLEAEKSVGSFVRTEKRFFDARRIEIISLAKMAITISGRQGKIEGTSVISQNVSNPNPLSILLQRGKLMQNPDKLDTFFVQGEGMISISGEKKFNPLEKLEKSKGAFELLPVKDPDLTSIDGMEFRQTGTVQVLIKQGAFITLS